MTLVLALSVALILTGISNSFSEERLATRVGIDRLCGEMDYRTLGRDGGDATPLKGVRIEIYSWREGLACCGRSQLLWKTTTGRDGSYRFKHAQAGQYWLVAHWSGKTFQMPIDFAPRKPTKGDCYLQGLEIDSDGNFKSWLRATM